MLNIHHLKTVRTNGVTINYFYTKGKAERNKKPSFNLYVMDPDAPVIYETVLTCQEEQIEKHAIEYIEAALC